MASLYFYYSSMDSGKSTYLLQASHNYRSAGKRVLLLTPSVDDRAGKGVISSRIGLAESARVVAYDDDLCAVVNSENGSGELSCIMVDEAQFLRPEQVWQLSDVVDSLGVPVLCFGLRTDAFGRLFAASGLLLGLADELCELKSICKRCTRKATMQVRMDGQGRVVRQGSQVQVGGNESYLSVCRKHYKALIGFAQECSSSTNVYCCAEDTVE